MRDSYHEELEDINSCLVEMANAVGSAMSTATTALLDADVALLPLNLFRHPARTREAAAVVLELLQAGAVSLPMTSFALAELDAALAALSAGTTVGRVVLLP